MGVLSWDKILSECKDYRDGFVKVFRKYEGQLTDEKDGRGAIVQVTVSSFARHVGIADETFRRWVRNSPIMVPIPADKDQEFDDIVAGLVLDIPEEADIDTRLVHAAELAGEGLSFRKIGEAVGLDESTVRRDMGVREAKAKANPAFDVAGESVKHYDRTIACDLPSADAAIEEVDMLLDRISKVYTLSKRDRTKLLKVLSSHLERMNDK